MNSNADPTPTRSAYSFASTTLRRHLINGALGSSLLAGSAWQLQAPHVASAVALAAGAMVILKGCPTCWTIGLIQLLARGRLRRRCADGVCALDKVDGDEPESSTLAA